jgi:glyoxylase-like metal-dependent hydrolase (beta-lactamase superfamily II)
MFDENLVWQDGGKRLYVFQFGRLGTHTGVFTNGDTGVAFLVDAPFGSHEFLARSLLRGFTVEALLITHGHWDHIGDGHLFKRDGAKVYARRGAVSAIEDPSILIQYVGSDMGLTPCKVDSAIGDDSHFQVAGIDIYARGVPGHSPGDVFFYMECAGVVFAGDTLFRDGIGRTDLVGGSGELLIDGIVKKLLALPDETLVIPGHGEFTNIGYERVFNTYLG